MSEPIQASGPVRGLIFIGAPGAGKSTVGALVATKLGEPFIDVDAEIERRVGRTIADLFVTEGEEGFRALEREVTLDLLQAGGVISLGGGAVMNPAIREALVGHDVVWLKVSITQATRRVGMNTVRPLLLGNVRAKLASLLRQRTPIYEQCSTIIVDTDTARSHEIARQVVDAVLLARGAAPEVPEEERS